MGLLELKADCSVNRDRIAKLDLGKLDEAKLRKLLQFELAENIFPMFEALIEAIQEEVVAEVADLGEAVSMLEEGVVDTLHPETATQIVGVLEVGKLVANELEALAKTLTDDVKKKSLAKLLKGFRQGVEVVKELVQEMTLDEDDDADAEQAEEAPEGPDAGRPGESDGDEGDEEDDEDLDDEDDDDDFEDAAKGG